MENMENPIIGGLTEYLGLPKTEVEATEQKTDEQIAAQALLDSQNAEAEAARLAEEQAKTLADEEAKKAAEAAASEEASLGENKSFLDTLAEADPNKVVEVKPEAIKAELDAAKAELEALKKEREELENSDIAKLLKSGLKLEDIAKGITKVDYSNHSIEDLVKLELEKQGLKDTDLENALEQEMAAYENLTPLAKSRYDNELKASYKSEIKFDEATKLLEEKLKENAEKFQAPDPKAHQEAIEKMKQADLLEIDGKFNSMKAQNFAIEDERINAIKAEYNPLEADLVYTDKEGKFDVNRFIRDKYLIKFGEADAKAREQAAYERGVKEAAKKYANPDKSNIGGGGEGNGKTTDQQLRETRGAKVGIPTELVKNLIGN